MNFYKLDTVRKYREVRKELDSGPVLRRPRVEPTILNELIDVP